MPPELARELVTDLRAWYEDHNVSQKNLARKLYLSPQQLSEIFAGRNRPTGEQVLRIQEWLRTNNLRIDIDPRTKPRPAASNPGPKTLTEARDRIADLEAQLRSGVTPRPAAQASPGRLQAAPTRQGIVAARMPEQKLAEKLSLPASATTPFLADEIIKVTPTDSLRRMLDSETISWRKAALYRAIKEREKLSTY
jgi:transcriptional regulator with XRE-family HTH domain